MMQDKSVAPVGGAQWVALMSPRLGWETQE